MEILGLEIPCPIGMVAVLVGAFLGGIWVWSRRVVLRRPVILFRPGTEAEDPIPFSINVRPDTPPEIVHGDERFAIGPSPLFPKERPLWADVLEACGFKRSDRAEVWKRANGKREIRVLRGAKWKRLDVLPRAAHKRAEASA